MGNCDYSAWGNPRKVQAPSYQFCSLGSLTPRNYGRAIREFTCLHHWQHSRIKRCLQLYESPHGSLEGPLLGYWAGAFMLLLQGLNLVLAPDLVQLIWL